MSCRLMAADGQQGAQPLHKPVEQQAVGRVRGLGRGNKVQGSSGKHQQAWAWGKGCCTNS